MARTPARVVASSERDKRGLRRVRQLDLDGTIIEATDDERPGTALDARELPIPAGDLAHMKRPEHLLRRWVAERRRATLRDDPAHVEATQRVRRRIDHALAQHEIRQRAEVQRR